MTAPSVTTPASASSGRDLGLKAGMLLTMILLGVVYVVLIAVLIAAGTGVVAVAVIVGVLFVAQYFGADRIALGVMGARDVGPETAPQLHATLERLCTHGDLPMPRIAIAHTAMPNVLTVGRSPSAATVCMTSGLLALLEPGELEAVLAHELAHVRNRDVMPMTIAGCFASIAAGMIQIGSSFGGHSGDGDSDRDSRSDGDDATGPGFIVMAILSGLVYVISFVLIGGLSRHREFAADRSAAIITRRPGALSSALAKIDRQMRQIPQRDLRAGSGELAPFFIVAPQVEQTVAGLFATHPPLQARLDALAHLESRLR